MNIIFLLAGTQILEVGSQSADKPIVLNPTVVVIDQPILDDNVTITRVVSSGLGWIVIHADSGSNPGAVLGQTQVSHGINSGVIVTLNPAGRTPKLYAMLHTDSTSEGTIGVYDGFSIDGPVLENSEIITPFFNILAEGSSVVLVNDQPIVGGKVEVLLTNLNMSGWVVIHSQSEGNRGSGIGETFLSQGINRNIIVSINIDSKTEIMEAMLHYDFGLAGVYDGLTIDAGVRDINGNLISPLFKTSNIEISGGDTTAPTILEGISGADLHIILSILSGVVLISVGLINITRNFSIRLNQIFFVFFLFIALYQIFDALLVYLGINSDNLVLNTVRDLSILFLVLGLAAGAFSGLMIHYGEDIFFEQRNLGIGLAIILSLLILGLLGDSVMIDESGSGGAYGGSGAHIATDRSPIGWIGITGSFLIFSGIIVYTLVTLLPKVDNQLKTRILRLLAGFLLAIILLFLFDVAFAFEFISEGFMGDSIFHFLMHETIVLGVLFVLSAFWTPVKELREDYDI